MMRSDEPCFWELLEQRGFSNVESMWGTHYGRLEKISKSIFQADDFLDEIRCGKECVQTCAAVVMESASGGFEKHCPQRRFMPEPLNPMDALRYRINIEHLHKSIARSLGINEATGENKISGAQHTYFIGRAPQGADREMREHFISYCRDNKTVQRSIDAIIRHQKHKPYVLLLPTSKNVDAETERLLNESGGSKIILSDTLPLQSNGKFGIGTANEVREVTAVYSPEEEKFKTPEGCTWEDITIEFMNDDQVKVSAHGVSGVYHYRALGFGSDNKTTQKDIYKSWAVLMLMSKSQQPGILYYRELGYDEKELKAFQKQKQELSKTLKAFFGISDEPIPPHKTDWTYRCRFQLKPNKKTKGTRSQQDVSAAYLEMDSNSEYFDYHSPSYSD